MRFSINPFLFLVCLALPFEGHAAESAPNPAGLKVERLPDGTRYALLGDRPARPAPTLFVFQGDIDVAKAEPLYTEVGRLVARHGFIAVVIDAPAHGEDRRAGEPVELAAWCWRVEHGEDLVGGFIARSRAVLDHLITVGYTDPTKIAACGTSRGGFLAFQLAAAEPRIGWVGGISPVTDLMALREFHATSHRKEAQALALEQVAPKLAGRPSWIRIGNNDARVSTVSAIAFSRALVAAAPANQESIPVELCVHSASGHRSSEQDHALLAAWLLEQMKISP